MQAKLFADGGSRGNPGKSASGAVLYDDQNNEIGRDGIFLGINTNNFAEYSSLKIGVELALKFNVKKLSVFLDSKLVVEQMSGNWKIKDAQLKIISQEIFQIINSFEEITFHHIPREKNKVADSIVNQVLDGEG